jgi:hypothetical protein
MTRQRFPARPGRRAVSEATGAPMVGPFRSVNGPRHALGDAARQARPVIDPDHRQIARRVAADQPCLARLRVACELDLETGRVPGHVGVGGDVALIVKPLHGGRVVPDALSTTSLLGRRSRGHTCTSDPAQHGDDLADDGRVVARDRRVRGVLGDQPYVRLACGAS